MTDIFIKAVAFAADKHRNQRRKDVEASPYINHPIALANVLANEGGIANMNYSISNNAEYGEYVTGPRVIGNEAKLAMKEALKNIQNGEYAKRFILEGKTNYPEMTARRRLNAEHPIEKVGSQLRSMMPWIAKNKLVDQSKN